MQPEVLPPSIQNMAYACIWSCDTNTDFMEKTAWVQASYVEREHGGV